MMQNRVSTIPSETDRLTYFYQYEYRLEFVIHMPFYGRARTHFAIWSLSLDRYLTRLLSFPNYLQVIH